MLAHQQYFLSSKTYCPRCTIIKTYPWSETLRVYLSPNGNMGKAIAAVRAFIESIPDAKLTGFTDPNPTYTIYSNTDFRLDLQNVGRVFCSSQSHILWDHFVCGTKSFSLQQHYTLRHAISPVFLSLSLCVQYILTALWQTLIPENVHETAQVQLAGSDQQAVDHLHLAENAEEDWQRGHHRGKGSRSHRRVVECCHCSESSSRKPGGLS